MIGTTTNAKRGRQLAMTLLLLGSALAAAMVSATQSSVAPPALYSFAVLTLIGCAWTVAILQQALP